MIYPKKISSKKIDVFLNIFTLCVVVISVLLLIINYLTTPNIYWSHICICGFLYIFFTVRYSIVRTRNISGYVAFQTALLTLAIHFIDYRIGYSGWSLSIALPIIIIISNITMFVVTIINYKDYGKYVVSQLIILVISLSIIYFVRNGFIKNNPLINISIYISLINFLVSIILSYKDYKEEMIRKLNI